MTDDRTQARKEAAELLGVDVERLSPAGALRCDMIASLRLVIDAEQSAVLSGNQADLGKLNTAVTSLIALLPNRELPAAVRQVMFDIYMGMRRRGELADPCSTYEGRMAEIERLRAKVAALEARLAGAPVPDEAAAAAPAPANPANVVPLRASPTAPPKPPPGWSGPVHGVWPPPEASVPAPAAPPTPAPQQSEYVLEPVNEPWRAYSHLFE
jgi:hypothetical protein